MRYWNKQPHPIVGAPVVGLAVATYHQTACLTCLLASLQAQTYRHFRVAVVHDGPMPENAFRSYLDGRARKQNEIDDARFVLADVPHRGVFGHNCRVAGWAMLQDCTYLGSTNGDNYYAPVYLEAMVHALQSQKADLAYCNVVHSHKLWHPMDTKLERGQIDVGCWLAKAELVRATFWEDFTFAGDWSFLAAMLAKKPKVAKVKHYLMVHN